MEDKYKWVKQYASPCFNNKITDIEKLPHIKSIRDFLNEDYSREKVLDYFSIPHNLRTLKMKNYTHLLLPYLVEDINDNGLTCTISEPFFEELPIPLAERFFSNSEIHLSKEKGFLKDITQGEILLYHFSQVVDSCKKKELEKYDYLYANFSKCQIK